MPGIYRETGQGGNYDQGPAKWKGSLAVNVGDLIYSDSADSNYTKPSACATYPGLASAANYTTAAQNFKANFTGISMARRLTLQTTDGDDKSDGGVLTSGEFTMNIDSTTVTTAVGAYVAVGNSGNALLSSNVAVTSNVSLAIGKVSQLYTTGAGTITVKIFPQKSTAAGVQATA